MKPSFWRGKKVLITGHTGFKGSWLSIWLNSLGAQVTGIALAPDTTPSLFQLSNLEGLIHHIEVDVRNMDALHGVLGQSQPEIVFHMAAQSLVRTSYDNPLLTYQTNVMGTANLLECIRQLARPCIVVNVTTDKCYENKEWLWGYREVDPLGGVDPYSNSKACSELITASYRASFFNPNDFQAHKVALATARAGNVVGGGDWSKDRLVPDVLAALENHQSVNIRHPQAIRPWQHVLEPLHGYLMLAEKLHENGAHFSKAWNFGPSDQESRTVAQIVNKLTEMWGTQPSWVQDLGNHPHEAHYLTLDTALARKELGWKPMLTTDNALKLIVDWEQSRLNGADVFKTTLQQISNYQSMVVH